MSVTKITTSAMAARNDAVSAPSVAVVGLKATAADRPDCMLMSVPAVCNALNEVRAMMPMNNPMPISPPSSSSRPDTVCGIGGRRLNTTGAMTNVSKPASTSRNR